MALAVVDIRQVVHFEAYEIIQTVKYVFEETSKLKFLLSLVHKY